MTEKPRFSSEPHPPGWRDLIYEKVDFEAAFDALDGYDHFHTETLRGFIRTKQLRLDDARSRFRNAERLFPEAAPSRENPRYLFLLRLFAAGAAVTGEALDPGTDSASRTDREMARFVRTPGPVKPTFDQVRVAQIAYHDLIRGNFQKSLNTFEFLLEESRERLEPQQVAFSIGAAAAAYELGLSPLADKHYETAALGVNLTSQPFKVAEFSSRLYILLTHWGRKNEARDWLQRIDTIECPPESRSCFVRRGEVFTVASRARNHIFIL